MIAAIADIHGNVWALDAVLEDIERRGIQKIVNLGDHFYGPLAPGATEERLLKLDAVTVRGNQDRQLIEPAPGDPHPTHLFTLDQLSGAGLDWIRQQPATRVHRDLLLCHGSPTSDTGHLLEEVTPHGVRLRAVEPLPVVQRVILCGHTHIPRVIAAGGQLFVNPGSVGLPAYNDDQPYPHTMDTGSPHARYAILDGDRALLVAIPYDFRSAAAAARANNRLDWAHALETGFASRP